MNRRRFYTDLKEIITENVPDVRHIDLWNHNVEFIEQEDAWERPAVFVEFGPIAWELFQGRSMRGKGTVRLHIVTDWVKGGYDRSFNLSFYLWNALKEKRGFGWDSLFLLETATNHNHEDILESIDTYSVRYLR